MWKKIIKRGKYLSILLAILLFADSCDKIQDSEVPDIPFVFTIDLNLIPELTLPGNSVYFPGSGFGGVIVYCEDYGIYHAFDATCTYEVSNSCRIKNEGLLGTCPCCGSQFLFMSSAYPAKGPAAAPLRQYRVSQVNNFTLRVYN